MSIRSFLGNIRRKVIRLLLGGELFDSLIKVNQSNENTITGLVNLNKSIDALMAVSNRDSANVNTQLTQTREYTATQGKKLYESINVLKYDIDRNNKKFHKMIKKIIPHTYLDFLEIHLTEHCNLNCWGCSHFSPLADEEYLSLDTFTNDMKRLCELTSGNIGRINLMGGEPLLHPKVVGFFETARSFFSNAIIRLVTNGLLLKAMEEPFWLAAKKNDIHITPTKYPISVPWDDIENIALRYGVKMYFFAKSGENIKTMSCIALDVDGKQNQLDGFLLCHEGNNCIHLRKGKLYTCPIAAYAEHFNKYFKQNLDINKADSINIYTAESMKEILEFLSRPIPFCRYCTGARSFNNPWQQSKKEMSEWVVS